MDSKQVRIVMIGLGNVGRRVLAILRDKSPGYQARHHLSLLVVGVADHKGSALDPSGLDPAAVIAAKMAKRSAGEMAGVGRPGMTGMELLNAVKGDVLIEASPVNLKDGLPGLDHARTAVGAGMHLVLANKAPLVLAYRELHELAKRSGAKIAFSATVGGGLPAVNIGQRDLCGSAILKLEGVLNLTSHFILTRMASGRTYSEALRMAQQAGHAEADPTLDVDGWDAANKLVILANAVLNQPTTLADLRVAGIRQVGVTTLKHAREKGNAILPLALAERVGDRYLLSVEPTEVGGDHPLARLDGEQMGIVYTTDTNGVITAIVDERDPMPTAAAVVRDVLNLYC